MSQFRLSLFYKIENTRTDMNRHRQNITLVLLLHSIDDELLEVHQTLTT